MASGVIYGRVQTVKENAIMLDDGQWYSHREMYAVLAEQSINLRDTVSVSYWTKSNQTDQGWRNYRNVRAIRKVGRCDWKQLPDHFDDMAHAKYPDEGAVYEPVAEDATPAPF